MIGRIEWVHNRVYVHLSVLSRKATKSFTHGRIQFDRDAGTVVFGTLPPVPFPPDINLETLQAIELQLVGPDGTLRKQTRTGIVNKAKDCELYYVPGLPKTPPRFSADAGWTIEVFKFRAYLTHPGLNTTGKIPEWLGESVERQRQLWNRLAWLCREARRQCSPVPVAEIKEFVERTILPAIDGFNATIGISREKLKYPALLRTEMPGLDALWRTVQILRKRLETGRPVPEGLLESIVAFAQPIQPDYGPINEFLANVKRIGEREAQALEMQRYEIRPIQQAFAAVLNSRKTRNRPWSEGWPLLKHPDSRNAKNWAISYALSQAGVRTEALETSKGIPGLQFGAAKSPLETGHPALVGVASHRALREAMIRVSPRLKERREFRFGVLQHRPLPKDSHIKQWQLAEINRKLWLNLTLEVKRPIAPPGSLAAGLDIGWRRTEEGIRIGVLYEPVENSYREILIDFQRPPKDPTQRIPFRLNLGATRWEKRNITRFFPEWKPGDTLPGTVELRRALSIRRNKIKEEAKDLIRRHLGTQVPAWFERAGPRGILQLSTEIPDDVVFQEIVRTFTRQNGELNELASNYMESSKRRLHYGYEQIAHDLCRFIASKGLNRVMVEGRFLQEVIVQEQDRSSDEYYALRNSRTYRQFAAVGKFVTILKQIARKYGFSVQEVPGTNTTRVCHHCGHLNPGTARLKYECEGCHRLLDQDLNAAVNLSRGAVSAQR